MRVARPRTPNTYQDAVTRAAGVLTVPGAAEAVGKSASLIHAWMDADRDSLPSIAQAEALDRAVMAHGGEAVILDVYQRRLENAEHRHDACDPADRLMAAMHAVGDLAGEVRAARDLNGPGGRRITAAERSAIAGRAEDLRAELAALIRDVDAEEAASTVTTLRSA